MDDPKKDPALQKLLETIDNAPENILQKLDLQMSPELTRLLERGLIGDGLPPVLRDSKAAKAFQQAFDMIGGVPRLTLWADQNLTKFYGLYSKLMPATAEINNKHDINITIKYSNPNFNTGPVEDAIPIAKDEPPHA
jgi:hypothetical protein